MSLFRDDAPDKLRWALQARRAMAACCLQSNWRAYTERARIARNTAAAVTLQRRTRGIFGRQRYRKLEAERAERRAQEARC